MKSRIPLLRAVAAGIAVCAFLVLPMSSRAVNVTYYVNSSLSSLTLSGQAFGITYQPQVSGAMVDSWSGTITGDLTGGVLTLTGGSAITAVLNPVGPFSTAPAPYPTGGDDYGATGTGFVPGGYGVVTIMGVYRSLTFDITAGTATFGAPASGMTFSFTAGQLDWGATTALGPTGGTSSLIGVSGANTSMTPVILSPGTSPGDALMLPVKFHTTGSNRSEDWNGWIVAVIPEPSALTLIGFGLLGLVTLRRQRSL